MICTARRITSVVLASAALGMVATAAGNPSAHASTLTASLTSYQQNQAVNPFVWSASPHKASPPAAQTAGTSPTPAAATTSTAAPVIAQPTSYTMYDSTTISNIPAGSGAIATYANGSYANQVPAGFHGMNIKIDVIGNDAAVNALDIEPGDATNAMAAGWVQTHDKVSPNTHAILYTSVSNFAALKASVSSLPQSDQNNIRYWIADYTQVPHTIPGASAVQYYNDSSVDRSLVSPGF